MRHFLFSFLLMAVALSGSAETWNMEISLKNGSKQLIPADSVSEVRFVESQSTKEFNILTEEYIPDATLRNYIKATAANGADTYTNIQAAQFSGTFNLTDMKLYSIQGLEFFTNLYELDMPGCNFQKLDLSALKGLHILNLNRSTSLDSLGITGLNQLEEFNIGSTKLYDFDLTILPSTLKSLNVSALKYTNIDFSRWPDLEKLNIDNDKIAALDLSSCSKIKYIAATGNGMTSLNITGCHDIEYLAATYNTKLTDVDLSGCTKMKYLYLTGTSISNISVTPFVSSLLELCIARDTCLKTLDLQGCTALTYLECQGTGFSGEISFSSIPTLEVIRCEENKFTSVDVSKCNALREFNCYSMETLTKINMPEDQSHLTLLNLFSIPNVKTITLGNLEKINNLGIYYMGVKRLDLSRINKKASSVFIGYDNDLKEIKVWKGFDASNPSPIYVEEAPNAKFVEEFTSASE